MMDEFLNYTVEIEVWARLHETSDGKDAMVCAGAEDLWGFFSQYFNIFACSSQRADRIEEFEFAVVFASNINSQLRLVELCKLLRSGIDFRMYVYNIISSASLSEDFFYNFPHNCECIALSACLHAVKQSSRLHANGSLKVEYILTSKVNELRQLPITIRIAYISCTSQTRTELTITRRSEFDIKN